MRIIFGNKPYRNIINEGVVDTLSNRREKTIIEFANKAKMNPKFGPKWFPENSNPGRMVRDSTRRKINEAQCKTQRMRNNPIQYMIRRLNEQDGH